MYNIVSLSQYFANYTDKLFFIVNEVYNKCVIIVKCLCNRRYIAIF